MDLLSKTVIHALKKKERNELKKGGEVKHKPKHNTSSKCSNNKAKGKK